MKEKNYILAMYDIRGKQEFIYRSTHIKEIVGGSAIIRDCFKDYLFPEAEKFGKGIFHETGEAFTEAGFAAHLEQGYIGEVIYEGGGNFLLLYKDKEVFEEVTYRFTKKVMEVTSTLKVLGTYIEDIDFADFKTDQERLYRQHAVDEAEESVIAPYGTLPIVQASYQTSMPLVAELNWGKKAGDVHEKVTRESKAKYDKYRQELREKESEIGETILDNLVTKRGEESLLAVVYIDGNNMGAKVQQCYKEASSYEDCVRALRSFSLGIQKDYIDDRMKNIDAALTEKYGETVKRRFLVYAGDEITFICNARDAYDIIQVYLKSLPQHAYSCAGTAIFHSHAPYAEAYRIAEECCETGKIRMKKDGIKDISFMDFHYCQGAVGTSLEHIRETESGSIISKPWVVSVAEEEKVKTKDMVDLEMVERMRTFLDQLGRSNVKGLAECAKKSEADLALELHRIKANMPEEKRKTVDFAFAEKMDSGVRRKLIYDMVIMYDLWFGSEEEAKADETKEGEA